MKQEKELLTLLQPFSQANNMKKTLEEEYFHLIGKKIERSILHYKLGYPCYSINNIDFIRFYKNEMIFLLFDDWHYKALVLDGAKLFHPSGVRPQKNWVQVPFQHFTKWEELAFVAAKTQNFNLLY